MVVKEPDLAIDTAERTVIIRDASFFMASFAPVCLALWSECPSSGADRDCADWDSHGWPWNPCRGQL